MTKLRTRVVALLIGAAGLCGFATTASADGYQKKRHYAPAPCCFSWSGFYAGINGGYGFSADDDPVVWRETFGLLPFFGPVNAGSLDIAGGFGGIQVGYNAQNGPWVIGIEADLQGADISDSASATTSYLGGTATFDTTHRVGWFGTFRPRLGYTWDRTLLYATGGFAWGSVKHTMRWADDFGFLAQDTTSSMQVGYAVGGGIEHAFNCCWSVKLEYQYIDLGKEDYVAPELIALTQQPVTGLAIHSQADTDFHTIRVGLNWRWHDRRDKPLK
jgi:outer membrane immunogenic protein